MTSGSRTRYRCSGRSIGTPEGCGPRSGRTRNCKRTPCVAPRNSPAAWSRCWRTRRKPMLTACLGSGGCWPSWRPRWSPRRQRLWRGVARSAWPACWRTRRKPMLTVYSARGRRWPRWRPRWSPRRRRVSPAAWSRCWSRTRRKPICTACIRSGSAGRAGGQDGAQGGSGCGGAGRAALGRLAGGPEGNLC